MQPAPQRPKNNNNNKLQVPQKGGETKSKGKYENIQGIYNENKASSLTNSRIMQAYFKYFSYIHKSFKVCSNIWKEKLQK